MAPKYAKDQGPGFTNAVTKVAIIGAGGNVGKHMAAALVATGKHTVTAISREGSSSAVPAGVAVVRADYANEASLVAAMAGQQVLIISLSIHAAPGTHDALVAAAAKAGVPYVMPNAYGGDFTNEALARESLHGATVRANVAAIEAAGVSAWIALTCSFWYEWSVSAGPSAYGFDIAQRAATLFDDGTEKINTSTWAQCGRAVAALLSLKELPDDERDAAPAVATWANRLLYVSSFRVSQRDMLDSLHRVLGTTDADWTITKESSAERYKKGLEELQKGDRSAFGRVLYTRAFFPNGGGDYESVHGLANGVLGLPEEDLDEATKAAVELTKNGFWDTFRYQKN
ncbi:putative oxidoreductase CipA [Lasiosphaeria ovina]|uniref:Oxidoreductase CipA n=1 Tax=Lasiosphaeria ovina TaxID=92902 RepID=A0AAE0KBL7_9PEZI|nr:putative oxidoreductase CipA [Lasiosphaeria ovina]